MPLATLWFFVAYFRRGQDVRHHTELLRRQLALLTYPAEEAEARIRTISDSLRRQADELSRSSDHATVQLQELVAARSEEHTSELQSLMRISYAVFCLKKKTPS